MAQLGLGLADLTLVVNSHAHPDHMGGNAVLKRHSGARIAAPALEAGWLEDNEKLLDELWGSDPAALAHLELLGRRRVAETRWHHAG